MEQTEEADPKAKAQSPTRLRLPDQGPVVQLQFLQRLPETFEVVPVGGEEPREDHRLGLGIPGECLGGGPGGIGQRVPYLDPVDLLDPGDQVSHLTRLQKADRSSGRGQHPDLGRVVGLTGGHEPESAPGTESPVYHPDVADDPPVGVEVGVEDQRPQRSLCVTGRWRHLIDETLQQLVDPFSGLGRESHDVLGGAPDDVGDLTRHPVRVGRHQIDLVDRRDDIETGVDRHVRVRQGLSLDPLRRVHQ